MLPSRACLSLVLLTLAVLPALVLARNHHHRRTRESFPVLDLSGVNAAPYNISDNYVLGLSSGGFLAVQMHVAYSSEFKGAAIFAAGPYFCAQGSLTTALTTCIDALTPIDLPSLESSAKLFEEFGLIDGLGNITNSPVYLFHGQSDKTVYAPVNNQLYQMYLDFGAKVMYNNATAANHAWISPTGVNGCGTSQSPYISNCNVDVELELLTHMLQRTSINPAGIPTTSSLYSFSQDQYSQSLYSTPASTFSMDSTGYVYVPAACILGAQCAILTVLHGCLQGHYVVGSALIAQSNLNGYAETNQLIILYPQAIASVLQSNPNGCWDWWGYTGTVGSSTYATHGAPQMEIVRAILQALGYNGSQ